MLLGQWSRHLGAYISCTLRALRADAQTEEGPGLALCPFLYAVKSADRWQMACQCGLVLKTAIEKGRCLRGEVQEAEGKPGR